MRHLVICSVVAIAAIAAPGTAAAFNQLADPGFELTFNLDSPWNTFADGAPGNLSESSTSMPRSGSMSAQLDLAEPNGFSGFFQDVAATPGFEAVFSAWAKETTAQAGAGVEVRIEFRDSVADTEVGRTGNLVPTLTDQYSLVTQTGIVPAGADTARMVWAIQSFGASVPQQIFIDDAFGMAVPEPTAALLALLGLAPLARRR